MQCVILPVRSVLLTLRGWDKFCFFPSLSFPVCNMTSCYPVILRPGTPFLVATLMWEGRRGSVGGIHTGTPGITAGTADTEATCCRDGPQQVSQQLPNLLLDKGHSPEAF